VAARIAPVSAPPAWREQVAQAIVGLGYNAKDADRAVDAVSDQAGDAPNVGLLLRSALQSLSRA
jgi:holliday junction DNA helicase RuvA